MIKACEVLLEGDVIVYPTETFYALGVDPYNVAAIKKLFDLKGRESNKPISVLVKDLSMLRQIVNSIPSVATKLIEKFWPGPLTIVFEASEKLPDLLTAATGKIGVRISSNPLTMGLIEAIAMPITTTSANQSNAKAPVTVMDTVNYFGEGLKLFLDGGELPGKLGSTVVDVTKGEIEVIRAGELPIEVICNKESGLFHFHQ
ncbi:MAG: L-threonylcarbamoyladenylate synthase [Candidatus Scalindua sp.]